MEDRRGVFYLMVGKNEGEGPLGRPRCRWGVNNKVDLQEVGCGDNDWIDQLGIGTSDKHL
jgi:hypothetical protein